MEKPETKEAQAYRWPLGPGDRFQVEERGPDKADWYSVEVPEDHKVIVVGDKIRSIKGGDKVGLGRIARIEPESFFSEGVLVSLGKRARITFPKKEK